MRTLPHLARELGPSQLVGLFTVSLVKLWHTVDGLFMWVCPASRSLGIAWPDPPFSSWEFFTTLDYEWSFIQRRRPYLWTIWVRSQEAFLLGFVAQPRNLTLARKCCRFIPSRACQPLSR